MATSKAYSIGPYGEVGGRGQALIKPGQYRNSFTIYNIGSTTVYLNTDTQPTGPTDGAPLSPGSVVPWDSGASLYAVCPTAGSIFVSDNSGVPFDAGAIAEQILDQGLAQDIANAISITGTPPIDNLSVINDSGLFGGGSGYVSAPVSAAGWQSIAMTFSNGFPTRINPGRVSVQWYATQALNATDILGYDEFFVGTGTLTSFTTPVRGPWFQINVDGGGGVGGGGQLKTYGSYKAIASTLYRGQGNGSTFGTLDGSTDMGLQTWSGTLLNNSVPQLWQPGVVAGENMLTLRYVSATTISLLVRTPSTVFALTTYYALSGAAVALGQTDQVRLFLPPVPLEISVTNTGAANTNIRFTLTPLRPYVS